PTSSNSYCRLLPILASYFTPQGDDLWWRWFPQGVALGWHIIAFQQTAGETSASNFSRELQEQPLQNHPVAVAARAFEVDIGSQQVLQDPLGARAADAFEIGSQGLNIERFGPRFDEGFGERLSQAREFGCLRHRAEHPPDSAEEFDCRFAGDEQFVKIFQ